MSIQRPFRRRVDVVSLLLVRHRGGIDTKHFKVIRPFRQTGPVQPLSLQFRSLSLPKWSLSLSKWSLSLSKRLPLNP